MIVQEIAGQNDKIRTNEKYQQKNQIFRKIYIEIIEKLKK